MVNKIRHEQTDFANQNLNTTNNVQFADQALTGTLTADTINEYTGSNGVTIEGIRLEDGTIEEALGAPLNITNSGDAINLTAGAGITLAAAGDKVQVTDGNFQLLTGEEVNEIVTSISGSSTDDQLVTAQGAYESSVLGMKVAVPSTKTSTGAIGNWAFDETTGYRYLCYDTDKWSRSIYTINW